MTSSSEFSDAERITSVKAAVVGGVIASSVSLVMLGLRRLLVAGTLPPVQEGWGGLALLTLGVNGAIAALSGAVFAITYRYAVRQDQNIQLNLGVVFAFTLVRGLAQVDVGSAVAQRFWPFFAACGESFLMFGLTAVVLSVAMQRQWLPPFGQE